MLRQVHGDLYDHKSHLTQTCVIANENDTCDDDNEDDQKNNRSMEQLMKKIMKKKFWCYSECDDDSDK